VIFQREFLVKYIGAIVLPMKNKFRIHFVITGLGTGGAEMMLFKILSGINRHFFDPRVISLTDVDTLRSKFQKIEIPVDILGMKPGIPDPRKIFQLARLFRKERPHIVQTWMYHANLIGGLAARLAGDIPVVWNIRHSNLDPRADKKTTIWTAKLCAKMSSSLPKKIIYCAESAKNIHEIIGYDKRKTIVIPNGFDLSEFVSESGARERKRGELGLPPDAVVIGLVARFHPIKDHRSFFEAAAMLKYRAGNVHYVLCGDKVTYENQEILKELKGKNLGSELHLLGRRTDIPSITTSFDIATSSSRGEGFSNTIGEAMACGVPAVVTDVGDSAWIVGDTGKVVPPEKPQELCLAWQQMIELGPEGRARLGCLARKRVRDLFSLDAIIRKYENIYFDILGLRPEYQAPSERKTVPVSSAERAK
jgi:glycosyltransferase involved in cell wall biosynthesis